MGRRSLATMLLLLLLPIRALAQQELGHKVLGTLGFDAGSVQEPGFYLADRFAWYAANTLVDRNGNELPVGLDSDAIVNAFGAAISLEIPRLSTFWMANAGIPLARARLNTQRPEASLDRYGFGDLYVQPLKLGWRLPHADVVTGYAFYAPTGRSATGGTGGVGRGHWTHELSLGSAVYFDQLRRWRFSALGSLELNTKKRDIDVTRGSTIQVQGGVGGPIVGPLLAGVDGYGLWQVTDDSGADLPPVLLGARDRVYGIGAELGLVLPPIRSRFTVRYTHDLSVRSRPLGQLLLVGIAFAAWRPGP